MRPHPGETTRLLPSIKQAFSGHPFRAQGTPKLKRGQGNGSLYHPGMDMPQSQNQRGKGRALCPDLWLVLWRPLGLWGRLRDRRAGVSRACGADAGICNTKHCVISPKAYTWRFPGKESGISSETHTEGPPAFQGIKLKGNKHSPTMPGLS